MVNMNENGRKEYEQPKMNVVMIDLAEIIATSGEEGGTGGLLPGGGGVENE